MPWRPTLSAPTAPLHDPSRSDGLIGRVLADRFRLDRLIGTGGMATVYEAADLALGRTVAVKLFRMDTVDESGPKRQSGEVSMLAGLNHFALVTLFDAGTEHVDGVSRTFLVMEYVDGADLRSRIIDGAVAPAEVARMGADLAEALHYVHARGIIHRDIKPANVLLAPSDFPGRVAHAKLADFGIARLFDGTHLTRTGMMLGTAGYLSPEQALGEPIGPASDVYSLGLVLLECLTGARSYPGTAIESAMARLHRQPEIPAEFGTGWAAVLAGMTTRDPADWLSSADAAVRLRDLVPAAAAADPAAADLAAADTAAADSAVADTAAATLLLPRTEEVRTRLFEAPATPGGQADQPTVAFPAAPAPAPRASAQRPSALRTPIRRRRFLIGGGLVAVLALAAGLVLIQPKDPAAEPVVYPAVEGDLGVHLNQLQESVQP